MGEGTRTLTLNDLRPDCEIVEEPAYRLADIIRPGDVVADIGCGHGPLKTAVEGLGARWVGIEPFPLSPDIIDAPAEDLPFPNNNFDCIIMDAVIEHIPNVEGAFAEVERTLKPGGYLIGYLAFMECFHEISYQHLSHKGLEDIAFRHGLKLEKIAPTNAYGIDYHVARLLEPFILFNSWPTRRVIRPFLRSIIRIQLRLMQFKFYLRCRLRQNRSHGESGETAKLYFDIQRLRLTVGFTFVISKPN
jgi:SAM-dependent methyltransferase